MTCKDAREAFTDLYDGVLSGAALAALNRHLEECPACRTEWVAFQKAIQAVTDLGSAMPSPGFAARLRREIERPAWWRQVVEWAFVPLRVKVPLQAAALLLVGFAGLLMYQRSPEIRKEAEIRPAPPAGLRREPLQESSEAPPPSAQGTPDTRGFIQAPPRDKIKARTDAAPQAIAPKADRAERDAVPSEGIAGRSSGPVDAAKASGAPTPHTESKEERLPTVAERSADELYRTALADLDRRGYDEGIAGLRAFIARSPGDARVPEARLRLADAYVAKRQPRLAIAEYETLVREFPESPLIPAALYRQGLARLELGDGAGCQVLREVTTRYPRAAEAAQAREALSSRCQ
jgi:TolA-binding protein